MPNQTQSKRIALSVRPELYEKLKKVAEYQNKAMSRVVNDVLEETESSFDLMINAFEKLESGADKNKILKDLLIDGLKNFVGKISK
jgi:predicted DNA-binding protein